MPEDYIGVVTQLLALRKGRLRQMVNHGTGWARMEYLVPARGLIGFRTEFLTETRGTGSSTTSSRAGSRGTASCVRGRRAASSPTAAGAATAFAILNLQERGSLFVEPGDELYEGMVVGENARAEDLDVNASKEKKLTNMRAVDRGGAGAPDPAAAALARAGARADPRRRVRRGDAEVASRLRKVELSATKRASAASRRKREQAEELRA